MTVQPKRELGPEMSAAVWQIAMTGLFVEGAEITARALAERMARITMIIHLEAEWLRRHPTSAGDYAVTSDGRGHLSVSPVTPKPEPSPPDPGVVILWPKR